MVPGVPRAVRVAGGLAGVERVAHGPVPDRVHVHLEPVGVQRRHGLDELVVLDVREASLLGLVAGRVAVGSEHRAGVVLEHAVAHDLRRGRVEGARGATVSRRDQLLHLLDPAVPVPPERPHDAGGELAALAERAVRVLGGRRHPRVLPSGDPEGVEVGLREQDRLAPTRRGPARGGDASANE